MTSPETIYLMDASAFIHRAFHAIRNLSTKSGRPTGAAYGFTATLLRLLKDKKPRYLAVVYDSHGPSRRREKYPPYKANRPPMDPELADQQEIIREIVKSLGLFSLEETGFEADDLIAVQARRFVAEGYQVVIVSGDKDFYQLLGPQVSMYDPDPKKSSAMTENSFRERFSLEPQQFLEMQALMGDSSDNIPGVPKIGEKTAQKLIVKFKSLDNLYQNLDQVEPQGLRERLIEHKESAYLSRILASLGQGAEALAPLESLSLSEPDHSALGTIFKNLEFLRLLKDIPASDPGSILVPAPPLNPLPASAENGPDSQEKPKNDVYAPKVVDYEAYVLVNTPETWERLLKTLQMTKRLAVDLETDSLIPSSANIVGLSLCGAPNQAFYIPVAHQSQLLDTNQPWAEVKDKIGPFLTDPNLPKIGQNAKFDWLILARHGLILPAPQDDPMLASYLLNPDDRHGLDALSLRYLDHKAISFSEMVPQPNHSNFSHVPTDQATRYAAEDADLTFRLAGLLRAEIRNYPQLETLYVQMELPLEELLSRIEGHGVMVNTGALRQLSSEMSKELLSIEKSIFEMAGHSFNLGSPKQLAEVLFVEQKLPGAKKTAKKTSLSTDNEVLTELAPLYPIAREIVRWRELAKFKNTYTDKLPLAINPKTGRIHTSYNQTRTATGRLSSSNPNLQNIPARTEEGHKIRAAFVAPKGFLLLSADYSQIELRVLAHFSKDRALILAFENDEDIHRQTAAEIFGLSLSEVNPEQRREAKTINFGVVYGQGAYGLAKQLGIPQARARDFIDRYFARFPGVKKYMDDTRHSAAREGLVETWFGRRRYLPALTMGQSSQASREAERMAINTPIQGTAADIIKMAMLLVDRKLSLKYPRAKIIMQVHDELVLEVPEEEAPAIKQLLIEQMALAGSQPPLEGARPISVALKVEVGIGKTWTHG